MYFTPRIGYQPLNIIPASYLLFACLTCFEIYISFLISRLSF